MVDALILFVILGYCALLIYRRYKEFRFSRKVGKVMSSLGCVGCSGCHSSSRSCNHGLPKEAR